MTDLSRHVELIYQSYRPLNNVNQHLMKGSAHDGFRAAAEKHISQLDEPAQRRLNDEFFGWGPIEELRRDEDVFDIIIQGPHKVFVETSRGLRPHHDQFLSQRSFQNFVEALTNEAGILMNQKDPFGNGKVGPFRIHIIAPPASPEITITLRRHRTHQLSLDDLQASGFLTSLQHQWLLETIERRKNILLIGPTGSGKTTFLNSILGAINHHQRLVVIEDTDEIQSSHPMVCKLLSRELCPPTLTPFFMEDLLKQALRMRPDRIIIGEVRGKEAKDLLQALATGHSGSLGTLHAETAQQALIRLEMLIQMGAPQWNLHSIRQLIRMSLDYLVVLKEDRQQKGIKEICRIGSLESFGLLLEPVRRVENQFKLD